MVDVAQSVRASDCGSEGRRFETDLPPCRGDSWIFSTASFFLEKCDKGTFLCVILKYFCKFTEFENVLNSI